MTREPEWDDYTVTRALALAVFESKRCPICGNYDSLVPLPLDQRNVTWAEHDAREFTVDQFRCLACGAADLIKRDWLARHEKDKPVTGQAAPGDGRMFVAQPTAKEVS